jgi:hypothetical protein
MIHKQHYFAWVREKNLSRARTCLRSAIRTVASAMSAPFRPFSETLYLETRRLLENAEENAERGQTGGDLPWTANSNKMIPLEQIQALLLLAHYELLCVDEHEAMLTAGRVFRLVQMTRLYSVDKPDVSTTTAEAFVEAEAKRRTFWLAFILDRFLCSRDELPLTLNEEMVCLIIRPAPGTHTLLVDPLLQRY